MTAAPAASRKDIVLAFSGGLDTSFCVPWLIERGWRVTTLFVDTGGVDDAQRDRIAAAARRLGAHRHVCEDAADELWQRIVVPMVQAGRAYQDQYPLLCSDRYLIARRMVELARRIGAGAVAHGCTAMGNDQVRFDVSLAALADLEIVAPIRELQTQHASIRDHEIAYLRQRGVEVEPRATRYTINENLLGVTVSGGSIDAAADPGGATRLGAPGDDTYFRTAPPARWPHEPARAVVGFEGGVPTTLDGAALPGPALLAALDRRFGPHGVGRGTYTGDTTIGLKGRIVFECPGLTALLVAHRALEEAVLSRAQNAFKPHAARQWVQLVYEGLYFEPLRSDLEAFIRSTQEHVTGTVELVSHGGACAAEAVVSPNIVHRPGASYAQASDWTGEQALGFITLFGQSTVMTRRVRRGPDGTAPGDASAPAAARAGDAAPAPQPTGASA